MSSSSLPSSLLTSRAFFPEAPDTSGLRTSSRTLVRRSWVACSSPRTLRIPFACFSMMKDKAWWILKASMCPILRLRASYNRPSCLSVPECVGVAGNAVMSARPTTYIQCIRRYINKEIDYLCRRFDTDRVSFILGSRNRSSKLTTLVTRSSTKCPACLAINTDCTSVTKSQAARSRPQTAVGIFGSPIKHVVPGHQACSQAFLPPRSMAKAIPRHEDAPNEKNK